MRKKDSEIPFYFKLEVDEFICKLSTRIFHYA